MKRIANVGMNIFLYATMLMYYMQLFSCILEPIRPIPVAFIFNYDWKENPYWFFFYQDIVIDI